MAWIDDALRDARAQCAEKRRLEARVVELEGQCRELMERRARLEAVLRKEEDDVARLESGSSLAGFFYDVVGYRDQQLDKEREEAYAARVKLDAADAALASAQEDLARAREELDRYQGADKRYEALLKERAEDIKARGGDRAEDLMVLEVRLDYLEGQEAGLYRALVAGENALRVSDRLRQVMGGIFPGDRTAREKLDAAQETIKEFQNRLRIFRTELSSVAIPPELRQWVEGFSRFADAFLDSLFADWMLPGQVQRAKTELENTRSQLIDILNRLDLNFEAIKGESAQLRQERERLLSEP